MGSLLPRGFTEFFPVFVVDLGGFFITILIIVGLLYKISKWRRAVPVSFVQQVKSLSAWKNLRILGQSLLADTLLQQGQFPGDKYRWFAHFTMFWGFIGAAITTSALALVDPDALPLPLTHPVKVLGNISGVLLMTGSIMAIVRRFGIKAVRRYSTFQDAYFTTIYFLVALTGFLTEFLAIAQIRDQSQYAYLIHLVTITIMFALAPFTKFIHALSRPLLALHHRYENEFNKKGSRSEPLVV